MAKAKHKKFKKNRNQTLAVQPQLAEVAALQVDDAVVVDGLESEGVEQESLSKKVKPDSSEIVLRRDVNKVLLTMGTLVILLIGMYFVKENTNVLNGFGDWIYRVANIQTL
ncbi:MAG: hypothetical protein BWY68_00526 [bacterium ADurb.Bin400]|nr:MAG: hypothetical protein BWY68_00526 [bacterium ADurb.Bin400]